MQTNILGKARTGKQRVLVVDDDPAMLELVHDIVGNKLHCTVQTARGVREARQIMKDGGVDLLLTDVNLPDGNGMTLLDSLGPEGHAIVMTGLPSVSNAITAIRQGASDLLSKPFTADLLTERVSQALDSQKREGRNRKRLATLRKAVKRLNEARKVVSKKVDLLCNDLIAAYSDLSRQFDAARLERSYQETSQNARDLEQLLCHTMDWMLRHVGFCNVGIWLAADEEQFNLGAYMKYTVAGNPELTEALEKNLVRMTARKGFVHIKAKEQEALTAAEQKYLVDHETVAINCSYLGESLGVIVLFRDQRTPFAQSDIEAIRAIAPLFSGFLTGAVKAAEGQDRDQDQDQGQDQEGPVKEPGKKKVDPADWWKRGESPPF